MSGNSSLVKSLLQLNLVLALFHILNAEESDKCPNLKTDLRSLRKRRHLTFPDGSNFVITISLAKAFPTHVPSGWMMATDLDVMFPMPNANFTNTHSRKKLHFRQKRQFWDKVKETLYIHNMDGHACVLRTICEARDQLTTPGKSLVNDLLRALFTTPPHDEHFLDEFGETYKELFESDFCDEQYNCPLSIVDFVLSFNKYNY